MQPLLNLRLAHTAALITVDTACTVLGVDSETISAMIDNGDIAHAWDVSARQGRIRELRLWAAELADRSLSAYPVTTVISSLLPARRERFRSAEAAALLRVSDPHIHKLIRTGALSGPLAGHTQWITHPSLAEFLRARKC